MKPTRFARIVAVGAVASMTACVSPLPAPQLVPPVLEKADVERASVSSDDYAAELEAFRQSSLKLGSALLADGGGNPGGNVVASPASLLIALSMLRAGATGGTAVEMDQALGLPEKRDEGMNALLASLEEYDGDPSSVDEEDPPRKPVMHPANGLFIDRNVPTGEEYLDVLARHYGTGVYRVDFADQATTEPLIDSWVEENTGGRIKKAPLRYQKNFTLTLLNTLYLAAAWDAPFAPEVTDDRPFTTAGGETVDVPTMAGYVQAAYAEGDGWRAIDLPYAEGFAMRLVLPDADAPQGIFDAGVLGLVAEALGDAPPSSVALDLPKWDHKSEFELLKVLAGLGLNSMLTTTTDFDSIQRGAFVSAAGQAANITVAEKGTVAAAVTQIAMEVSGVAEPDVSISFDRPFQYQIVHLDTGMPLFMGKVADPR